MKKVAPLGRLEITLIEIGPSGRICLIARIPSVSVVSPLFVNMVMCGSGALSWDIVVRPMLVLVNLVLAICSNSSSDLGLMMNWVGVLEWYTGAVMLRVLLISAWISLGCMFSVSIVISRPLCSMSV